MKGKYHNYWKKRVHAKKTYSNIGRIWCPALSDWVNFNTQGFTHLLRKGKALRPEKEQIRRFKLLKFVPDIISDHTKVSHFRKMMNQNENNKDIKFWGFERVVDGQMITVVIRQVGMGQKHFFSVMNEKIK